jgi:hypothetical protein
VHAHRHDSTLDLGREAWELSRCRRRNPGGGRYTFLEFATEADAGFGWHVRRGAGIAAPDHCRDFDLVRLRLRSAACMCPEVIQPATVVEQNPVPDGRRGRRLRFEPALPDGYGARMDERDSHIFLHLGSVGDRDACTAVRDDITPLLKELYARGEIRGYRRFVIRDREGAEDEILHHIFDYEAATGRRFPFVYAALTPHVPEKVAMDEIMAQRGFRRFA